MSQNKSSVEMVREFHEAFGAPVESTVQSPSVELITLRLGLILEEFEELVTACAKKDSMLSSCLSGSVGAMTEMLAIAEEKDFEYDPIEVADALGDLKYVVNGMALATGIDIDKVVSEIHSSNMSKVCKDEDVAKATCAYYLSERGEETRYVRCTGGYVVERASDGKILKSLDWNEPDIRSCLSFDDDKS